MSSKRESYRWARLMMTAAACGWAMGCVAGCGNGRYYRYGEATRPRTIAMIGDKPLPLSRGDGALPDGPEGGGAGGDGQGSGSGGSSTRLASAPSAAPSRSSTASVMGRVFDESDLPVADARVRLAGLNRQEIFTDSYGRFEIKGLRFGQKYTVIADLNGETTQRDVMVPDERVRLRLNSAVGGSDNRGEPNDESDAQGPGARTARNPGDESTGSNSNTGAGARPRRASNSSSPRDDTSLLDLESGSGRSFRRYQDEADSASGSNASASADEDGRSDPYPPPSRKAASTPYADPGGSRSAPGWRSEANLDWGVKTQSWTRIKPGDDDFEPRARDEGVMSPLALAMATENQGSGRLLAADSSAERRGADEDAADELPDPTTRSEPKRLVTVAPPSSVGTKPPSTKKMRWEDLNWPDELLEPRGSSGTGSRSRSSSTSPSATAKREDALKPERSVRRASNSVSSANTASRRGESAKRDEGFVTASCDYDAGLLRLRDFQLPDLGGKPVSFKNLQADYVLLDFWGTWCGPCNASVPHLVRLQKKYGPKKLQVVGVAYETADDLSEAASRVAGAQRALGINYPLLLGRADGSCPLLSQLHVDMYPTMILLDRNGRIIWRDKGAKSSTLARLDRVLAGVIEGRASKTGKTVSARPEESGERGRPPQDDMGIAP